MLRVTEFCKDIRDTVFGESNKNFVQENRTSYSSFKDAIVLTTPDFRPSEDNEEDDEDIERLSSRPLVISNTPPRGLTDVRKVIMEYVDRRFSISGIFTFL